MSSERRDHLEEEVTRLTALVQEQGRLLDEQRRRVAALEGHGPATSGNGQANGDNRHSRRELLRLAGITAAGAAGAVGVTALQGLPAAAASAPNPPTLGTANDANATTALNPSSSTPNAVEGLLEVDGSVTSGATPGIAVSATNSFFRSIRGIAPKTTGAVSGVGVWGSSDAGAGVVGSSSSGVDIWSFNTGRIMQSAQPAGAPAYQGGVYDTTNGWTDFELVRDANGVLWIFLPPSLNGVNQAPGTAPGGTWVAVQPGGAQSLFSVVSTNLMALGGNDGQTFTDMARDTANGVPAGGPDMVLSVTPKFNCNAVITGNADLYTDTSTYNQDIGIYVNPSTGTQNIVAWKESGGSAGINSPNAAFVQGVVPMVRGTTYDVRLRWKTNKAQVAGAHIRAGAGPFPAGGGLTSVSPTRLTVQLVINP